MSNIQLDNFLLEPYRKDNIDHRSVIITLGNDKGTQKYLGDLDYMIERIRQRRLENFVDEIYIAYYNDYPIGLASLSIFDGKYEISVGLLPEYRGQHLAPMLLSEFSEMTFEMYPDLESISIRVNTANESAIKSIDLSGYEKKSSTEYSIKRM